MGLIFFLLGGGIGTLGLLAAASVLSIVALAPTVGRVDILLDESRVEGQA